MISLTRNEASIAAHALRCAVDQFKADAKVVSRELVPTFERYACQAEALADKLEDEAEKAA